MAEEVIQVKNLRKVYRQKGTGTDVLAIEDVSLSINEGEHVSIVGRTGCGKSTFLDILLGLEEPSGGTLRIFGRDPVNDFHFFKGRIGAIFQDDRLLPWRTALENVTLGLEVLRISSSERDQRAKEWLDRVGLSGYYDAYPNELSGGMRQRVAMARAFVINPDLLLADEAFGHLDEVTAQELQDEFLELSDETGSTAVMVTHQLDQAFDMSDRIIVFDQPARVLDDVIVTSLDGEEYSRVRNEVQELIDTGEPVETP